MPEVMRKDSNLNSTKSGKRVVSEIEKMIAEGISGSSWKSISALPKDVCFEAQNEGEDFLLLLRSHPITNLWWIGLILILLPIPFFWGEFPFFVGLNPILMLAINVLWYLHDNNTVHGDVKPQNIIIQSKKHTAVLVDYGLSSFRPRAGSSAIGYTTIFAAPEILEGKPPLPESDRR